MIDKENRLKAAELLAKFMSGCMPGDKVYENWPLSEDPALSGIGWLFICDEIEDIDKYEPEKDKNFDGILSRCVDFLHQDLEYNWPSTDCSVWKIFLDVVFHFGLFIIFIALTIYGIIVPFVPENYVLWALGLVSLTGALFMVFLAPGIVQKIKGFVESKNKKDPDISYENWPFRASNIYGGKAK